MAVRPPSRIRKAKEALERRLAAEPGFVGAGISASQSGQYEIIVLVMEKTSPVLTKVPSEWKGIPVKAQVGGVPRKF